MHSTFPVPKELTLYSSYLTCIHTHTGANYTTSITLECHSKPEYLVEIHANQKPQCRKTEVLTTKAMVWVARG